MTHAAPANGASAAVSRMADALDRLGTVPEDVRFSNPLSLLSYIPGLGRPGSMLPGAAYGIPAAVVNAPGNLKKMFMGAMEETGQRVTGQVPPGTPLSADMLGLLMSMPGAGMLMGPKGAVGMSGGRLASAAERLPMDEASRMARAAEYHTDLYHGTGSDISAFTRGRRGLWATDDPTIANIYAKFSDPAVGRDVRAQAATAGPNVMPLKLRGKVLTISDQKPGTSGGNGGWSTDNLARALGMDPDKLPPGTRYRDLMNEAKDRGYSAVKIEGMSDLGGDMQTQWSILDPSSVRSRFAAFDPAKRDSADLLAAGGVGPVGPMMLQAAPPKSEPLAHPGRGSAMGWY